MNHHKHLRDSHLEIIKGENNYPKSLFIHIKIHKFDYLFRSVCNCYFNKIRTTLYRSEEIRYSTYNDSGLVGVKITELTMDEILKGDYVEFTFFKYSDGTYGCYKVSVDDKNHYK